MSETPASSTGGSWWSRAAFAMVIVGVCGAVLLAALNHPHRAVLLLVATLEGLAVARLVIPGRPWFSLRSKWMDVAFFGGVGLLVWYFALYATAMGIVSSTVLSLWVPLLTRRSECLDREVRRFGVATFPCAER